MVEHQLVILKGRRRWAVLADRGTYVSQVEKAWHRQMSCSNLRQLKTEMSLFGRLENKCPNVFPDNLKIGCVGMRTLWACC